VPCKEGGQEPSVTLGEAVLSQWIAPTVVQFLKRMTMR
jgi:hypothetical protein